MNDTIPPVTVPDPPAPPPPKAVRIEPSDSRWWHVHPDQVSPEPGRDPAKLPRVRFDPMGRPFCY